MLTFVRVGRTGLALRWQDGLQTRLIEVLCDAEDSSLRSEQSGDDVLRDRPLRIDVEMSVDDRLDVQSRGLKG